MLPNMPMTAMIRSLGRMQAYEALGKEQVDIIGKKLNEENLKAARVHPMSVLLALATYRSGNGQRGSLFWKPNAKIVEALDTAFYLSFASVEPTGVPTLIGLDVSASMGAPVLNSVLSCREAAVAMAMITLKTEPFVDVYGFTTSFIDLRTMIKAGSSLQDNVNRVSSLPFGGTDCSLPMKWARQNRNMYGAFAIYTDNETWAGQSHASQELREYRRVMGSTARLAVQAFALNDVSIGDPDDPYTLGLAGLDASAPAIMSAFFRGEL
jgi:60 kDa SS-A/Ro ribonucleoprotein